VNRRPRCYIVDKDNQQLKINKMKSTENINKLAQETSPYLQQHAHNPVDWYPWGEEALKKARAEDKPILLSIGYSACHWCHVMAHESFEDPATAQVMNELFVNIKVDREERPDLDKIYQTAHHLLTQRSGGWPLTMFLTPDDQAPFFGGTYFPREERYGMPAFTNLMQRVEAFYRERRGEINTQNESLITALRSMTQDAGADAVQLNATPLDGARHQLDDSFDYQYGGFGAAPKFPHPTNIERLLRHWAATKITGKPDGKALDMVRWTLHAMASGGIYDQIGGGFCRYSVDERWMIPHFEKMLYDNGPLLALYADAWQALGDATFKRTAEETAQWVMREMQSPEGGYYSTLDADSEGEEGKFYVWTSEEVRQVLGDDKSYEIIAAYYGLDQPVNFEGRWHLHIQQSVSSLATAHDMTEEEVDDIVKQARTALFKEREQRVRPGRDEKILTSWNGLMIKGMAAAGRALQREEFITSAEQALDFIKQTLWQGGRLLATYKDGKAHLAAYLDDYAFLADGVLELLQFRWRDGDLAFAIELAEAMLDQFEDKQAGGFFFTANDHESLIHRPKPISDEALPSGNGIAAFVLIRLGHLLGEQRYLDAAQRAIKAAWNAVMQMPYAYNAILLALESLLYPGQSIVLRGEGNVIEKWQTRCQQHYVPRRYSIAIPSYVQDLPSALAEYSPKGDAVAYVCTGFQCQPPVMALDELEAYLLEGEVVG
jgi:uncharacterized protein YyaL (SSP411 family)